MEMTKSMITHGRSISCQGVSFDSPHPPLLDSNGGEYNGRWVWIPWNPSNSIKTFPTARVLSRTVSRPSSHYCDLNFNPKDNDDEDEDEYEHDHLHEQKKITLRAALDVEKQESIRKGQQASNKSRLSIVLLDQGLFTVYKRLFATCFTLNLIALVLAITGHFPFGKHRATLISMANILTLILCRSEAFLRIIFWLVVKVIGRPCVPLFIKTTTTSFLQSLGGIHSSCGVSSVAWLTYSLVLTLKAPENTSSEIVFIATTIAVLLILSCLSAFPLIRHLHHNVFERTHRFAGWIALALLWAFVVLTVCYNPKTKSYNQISLSKLAGKEEFWLTFAITLLIILPWLSIKRVRVLVTAPSGHASLIKFEGGIPVGLLGRISRSPLSEWHAFGIISNGKDNHMMLAGAVGDFTKGLVSDPPNHLWVRGLHFAGLPYLVNMYNRAVLVATGSGICVFLSFLLQPCNVDVCMVWVTKGVEENFGQEIKEMMSGYPKEKVIIHDTMISGRPNIAKISIEAAKNWKAEVVVVTSNPQGTKDVVKACKAAGFAAFGPIWDS
ncbi:putative ferredoxin-NADP reductase (FNR), nucleotide-binding domain-containing protein [Dioscorea sansibarensis]